MARIVKEEEYAGKRNAILDVAQRLIYTRGYEEMTIQNLLDALQISKGAFYHYFDSKQAVLEALLERIGEEVVQLLIPIVHDSALPALDKLRRFFPMLARRKTARKDLILALIRPLYADNNALFRQKTHALARKRVTPLLTEIIRQGVREGVLTTAYPDQVGDVIISLVLDFSDALAGLLLSWEWGRDEYIHVERTVAAYSDTLERALGTPAGSLPLVETETLKEWFVLPGDGEAGTKS